MLCFLALALVAAGCKSRADTRAIHEQKPGEESRRTVQPVAQPPNTASAQQSPLLNPEKASATAPGTYTVRLETTKGDIDIEVHRDWAPRGADRFYNLVKIGYFNDVAFFRVIDGFMAQTGLHGNPEVNQAWSRQSIIDDPVSESNTRGRVSFATSGKDSRGTQFFVNFGDNSRLDQMGFAPFGEVRDMKAVDALYSGYGESAPRGNGPSQMHIRLKGNDYLRANFPDLDYIKRAIILSQ
ncbi:MAG: peptidylprolyl isomerase [Deltaproteobacteria bacterium]|nr:peptidylprolyl isomerase [Deltaproteobacteria bacterium]